MLSVTQISQAEPRYSALKHKIEAVFVNRGMSRLYLGSPHSCYCAKQQFESTPSPKATIFLFVTKTTWWR